MADITVTCPSCGASASFSEYVSPETLLCPGCKQAISLPKIENQTRLRVRKATQSTASDTVDTDLSSLVAAPPPALEPAPAKPGLDIMSQTHKERGRSKGPSKIMGIVLFILLAGVLIGAQALAQKGEFPLDYYIWGRLGVMAVVMLLVLTAAFDDGLLQGFLCLLLPFYVIYYCLARMETYWLRGLFLALCAALGAEFYFMKDQAFLILAQRQLNQFIASVSNTIQWAGEAPEFK